MSTETVAALGRTIHLTGFDGLSVTTDSIATAITVRIDSNVRVRLCVEGIA